MIAANLRSVIQMCNRMEWVHSTITGNRFFLYLNTKQYFSLLVKIYCLYSPKFIHKMFIQLHKCQCYSSYKISNQCLYSCSKYQCYSSYKININSSQITSNKIHTYISMCIVVVHSVVHLSSSVPVLFMI